MHSFHQTAERVIDRATGGVKRWFISNAPAGHYMYSYPSDITEQRKQYGAKIFFTRCQYLGGPIKLETRLYKDYAWISRYLWIAVMVLYLFIGSFVCLIFYVSCFWNEYVFYYLTEMKLVNILTKTLQNT